NQIARKATVLAVVGSRESRIGLQRTTGVGRCGTAKKLLRSNYAQGIEARTLSQHSQEAEIWEAHEEERREGSTYRQGV
ncbi:MAG: hypothetical protein ACO23R_16120, partial [bacterium]